MSSECYRTSPVYRVSCGQPTRAETFGYSKEVWEALSEADRAVIRGLQTLIDGNGVMDPALKARIDEGRTHLL